VRADSAAATCEVRSEGEARAEASGPCAFSQRQGYIDVDLRNGHTYSLTPGQHAGHYTDQKGHRVVRTQAGGETLEFKWDNGKRLIVSFGAAPAAAVRAGEGKFDATGKIPCAQHEAQPMGQCDFGVSREGGGNATVVVTRPDGTRRAIFFVGGKANSADTSQADGYPPFSARREGDLNLVRVGKERYEIPDAVVSGG
jgi:hypothetical protein